jgi:flagellar biosynthesis protein FlhF
MQTKTYFASSVPAALETARKELGEDAMLVTSKPASPEARPFGRLEVTFAYDPKSIAPQTIAPQTVAPQTMAPMGVRPAVFPIVNRETESPARTPRSSSSGPFPAGPSSAGPSSSSAETRNLLSELDEIRGQISALRQAAARPGLVAGAPSGMRLREERSSVADRLRESGLGSDIAAEVAAAVHMAGHGDDAPEAVARELASRIKVAPFSEPRAGETKQIALVGPPGRGKTTTLIKIAVRFGLAARVPVKIYSAGSHGVGCVDQMARYASVLGVPFHPCESLENLGLALNGEMWKGLVLIDTPGISPGDHAEIGEFGRFFKRRPEIEKHLVLRADARSADIANVVARFVPLEVSRLLFTGLDEVVSLGSMADALMRTGIPASLSGTGQRIPEDLESVSAARMVRALYGGRASAAAAA